MNMHLALAVLTGLDWMLIVLYFVISLGLALIFTRRAGKSVGEFFTSGRSAPWWLAGISMVATTFAADTPLAVTGLVATGGVVGNWFWWSLTMSVMATVFIYAKLWRRVGVLTDVELSEARYSGKPAAFLRGFRALYLGLLMNAIILGWVTKGMNVVVTEFLTRDQASGGGITDFLVHWFGWFINLIPRAADAPAGPAEAAWGVMVLLYLVTGFYAILAGLWGVLVTDFFQFMIAIGMAIFLAVAALHAVGGTDGLQERLQAQFGDRAALYTNVLPRSAPAPDYSPEQLSTLGWRRAPSLLESQFIEPVAPRGSEVKMPATGGVGSAMLFTFFVFICIQWWSVWYPGHEPGGGGYIAQRILSAKNERHSLFATLTFSLCHFALRPWPWVIVGLFALVQYSGTAAYEANPNTGYAMAMFDLLGPGTLGLMLVSFLAAFMSTIATQINWGSSYIVNDLYQRFLRPGASQRHLVLVSRITTLVIVILGLVISTQINQVEKAWLWVMGLGAGTGLVYMLRWFWWRISALSEIAAMTASLVAWLALWALNTYWLGPIHHFTINEPTRILITVLVSLAVWIPLTFLTRPTARERLHEFYRRARPAGPGWGPVAREIPDAKPVGSLGLDVTNWLLGCVLIYGVLFGTWKLILGSYGAAILLLGTGLIAGALIIGILTKKGFEQFGK
jgi:SSS family solute:Na+ symporter